MPGIRFLPETETTLESRSGNGKRGLALVGETKSSSPPATDEKSAGHCQAGEHEHEHRWLWHSDAEDALRRGEREYLAA